MSRRKRARLVLEDGTEFEGWTFGAAKGVEGEVVFTTGMSGYPQSLTDPSYFGQILVNTYPLVGNYGVPDDALDEAGIPLNFESGRIWASGLVVSEVAFVPSHHASVRSLPAWMEAQGIPGIEGIDTRELTMRLRERGVMRGSIRIEGPAPKAGFRGFGLEPESAASHAVAAVSRREAALYGAGGFPRIALIDCGAKNNILRCLLSRGAEVSALPWNASLEGVEYDGVFLSNGPGDPKACTKTIATVRRALAGDKPVFGICLGAQIMALAAGADTYKLPYGHRGQNQPCVDISTGRCYITSQNHGYAVRAESLPSGWELWFTNGNDGTVEGIRSARGPFSAVQFHPEGCPGPRDTEFLFDAFLSQVRNHVEKSVPSGTEPAQLRETGLAREPSLARGPSLDREPRLAREQRLAKGLVR
jgi:carbamoyl-phosphate synthase small subunit